MTINKRLKYAPEYDRREDLREKFPCCSNCECKVANGVEVIGWIRDGEYLGWFCSDQCKSDYFGIKIELDEEVVKKLIKGRNCFGCFKRVLKRKRTRDRNNNLVYLCKECEKLEIRMRRKAFKNELRCHNCTSQEYGSDKPECLNCGSFNNYPNHSSKNDKNELSDEFAIID